MPSRRVTVTIEDGLHARPVAELVRLAEEHSAGATISARGAIADLRSVLAVMDLALRHGDEVVIDVPDSPGAEVLIERLARIVAPGQT